ncbi:hypothetical protein AVEN_221791-1 [Araneus ventricosus]|uniref:Uncharacterized protein n=1 Tax=Araneus ventricosus TaxID=182803 RepID=A0A4Y2BYB6_ARAVE|nr:hypothetical protein AVEN_221791-1 [Araneus ventricosus]
MWKRHELDSPKLVGHLLLQTLTSPQKKPTLTSEEKTLIFLRRLKGKFLYRLARCERFIGLIHHQWLKHDQRLNDGSAIIMRKLTEMRHQMYTIAGCYFGMVSQLLCCWRF